MIERVVLIGGGAVAEALGRRLSEVGLLSAVWCRNSQRATELAADFGVERCADLESIPDADLYVISVSDRAIEEVSRQLKVKRGAIVVHTAGSRSIEELKCEGAVRGVFYPLQTFTKGRIVDFWDIPLMVESESRLEELAALAEQLSSNVIRSNYEMRRMYHLSAVFACNFVNRMYVAAQEIARIGGIDAQMLNPLIAETARKALETPDAALLQSGPAARGDWNTIENHLSLLEQTAPEWRDVYELITNKITNGKL